LAELHKQRSIVSICGWIKCNSDFATKGSSGIASCCGIFRD